MLEHQETFDTLLDNQGITFSEVSGCRVTFSGPGFLLLQSASQSDLQDALTNAIGLRLPSAGEACVRGDYALLWLTPAEWLLECPAKETDSLQIAFTQKLAASLAVITDMSDAFACFEVSGDRAVEILMSGCSLDLHAYAFPAGRVARTALADIPAIIRNTGGPRGWRCIIDRSYARHIRDWLLMTTR